MFGLGITELLFIGVLALVLIGPEDLPRVARTIGRFLNELKRGGDHFREEFQASARRLEQEAKVDLDLEKSAEEIKQTAEQAKAQLVNSEQPKKSTEPSHE